MLNHTKAGSPKNKWKNNTLLLLSLVALMSINLNCSDMVQKGLWAVNASNTPPLPPENLTRKIATPSSITINWKEAFDLDGDNLSYDIFLSRAGIEYQLAGSSNTTEYTATNLDPDVVYSFKVVAVDRRKAESDFSNTLEVTTDRYFARFYNPYYIPWYVWMDPYKHYQNMKMYSLTGTIDGGYVVTASLNIFKFDNELMPVWNWSDDVSWDDEWFFRNRVLTSIIPSINGSGDNDGYLVAGIVTSHNSDNKDIVSLYKVDNAGNIVWKKMLQSDDDYWNFWIDGNSTVTVTQDSVGNIFLMASHVGLASYIIKTNNDGVIQWAKRFTRFEDMLVSNDGIILTGEGFETALVSANDGQIVWGKRYYPGTTSSGYQTVRTGDGYVICGYTRDDSKGFDACVLKINSSGEFVWAKKYGEDDLLERLHSCALIGDDIVVSGFSRNISNGLLDTLVMRIGSDGSVKWSKLFQSNNNDENFDNKQFVNNNVVVDKATEDIIVAGQSPLTEHYCDLGYIINDLFLLRISSDGALPETSLVVSDLALPVTTLNSTGFSDATFHVEDLTVDEVNADNLFYNTNSYLVEILEK